MKVNLQNAKQTWTKRVLILILPLFTAMYACQEKEQNTSDADATSTQDPMEINTGAGAGHSTDTTGTGTVGTGRDSVTSTTDPRVVIPPDSVSKQELRH